MRSPLASTESWVGWPRVVIGAAARILSMVIDMAACDNEGQGGMVRSLCLLDA